MSMGIGGCCRKFIEDDDFVICEYFSYDLNEPSRANEEKIFVDVPIDELLASSDIQIENSSFAWRFLPNGVDIMAYRLCRKIFICYQREGTFSENEGCHI